MEQQLRGTPSDETWQKWKGNINNIYEWPMQIFQSFLNIYIFAFIHICIFWCLSMLNVTVGDKVKNWSSFAGFKKLFTTYSFYRIIYICFGPAPRARLINSKVLWIFRINSKNVRHNTENGRFLPTNGVNIPNNMRYCNSYHNISLSWRFNRLECVYLLMSPN